MATIFVSYSRKDIEFAKRLTAELQKSDLDFWIDWEGIPPTVDWWKEIEKGIEESDALVFLISPDSAKSTICAQEVELAAKNGKRLIPIVVRDINSDQIPSQLKHLNWIFWRENDAFDHALTKLLAAIHTDFEWIQIHRRLQVKALEWERNHRDDSFLLRGRDLQDAEFQVATRTSKEPYLTDLQREYIALSRNTENIQHRVAQQRRNVIILTGIGLVALAVLAQLRVFNRFIYQPVDMKDYWITIPAGAFQMGSESGNSDEQPVHTVTLREYQIGRHEITNRQFAQCVKAGPCIGGRIFTKDQAFHPVVSVDWQNAKNYCEWVGGRLPTEAEWEKAASWNAETQTKSVYPWGNTIDCSFANYAGESDGPQSCVRSTTQVSSYENGQSPYGLYDMAGNVFEWVNDWYGETYYQNSPESNPLGPESGRYRVLRGGGWGSDASRVRTTLRYSEGNPSVANNSFGFRCARDPSP